MSHPCERSHNFRADGMDLDERKITLKDGLSRRIEPGALPHHLRKETRWACRGIREIGVGFQQMSLACSLVQKMDHIRTVANNRKELHTPVVPVN